MSASLKLVHQKAVREMVSQLAGQCGATVEQDFYVVGVSGLYGFSKHESLAFGAVMVFRETADGCL